MTASSPGLTIVEVGWATTIQDHGRSGYADLGVPEAGAVDRRAHDLANRLVGNPPGAATLETNRGLVIEAHRPIIAATSSYGARHTLRAGERLRVEASIDGMWGYLAIRGGIVVDPVLGSRCHDTLSGLGPPALVAGGEIWIGDDPRSDIPADLAPPPLVEAEVRVWPGPRVDWFLAGLAALVEGEWRVQNDVSRVGVRLSAGKFDRVKGDGAAAMPSEGLVEGAIQITPDGEPIVMLANHPTTGGYPVVGVVDPRDIGTVAQLRPGAGLRFRQI